MAQEVFIKSWCDVDLADGERVESTRTITATLTGWPKPREIDVCDHHLDVITAFETMIEKYGRVSGQPSLFDDHGSEKKTRRTPAPSGTRQARLAENPSAVACPVCLTLYSPGEGTARYKYVAQHMLRQHDQSVTDFTDDQIAEATAKGRAKVRAANDD